VQHKTLWLFKIASCLLLAELNCNVYILKLRNTRDVIVTLRHGYAFKWRTDRVNNRNELTQLTVKPRPSAHRVQYN